MRTIRLTIFVENYWNKGLIYTQNILPLFKVCKSNEANLEIISFTSIVKLFTERRKIREFKEEMNNQGVSVKNFPVLLYPTRFLIPRWFLLPFYFLNMAPYVWCLRLMDCDSDIVYNLRSYKSSLAFLKFYGRTDNLIFDPRTDWLEENINAGNFAKNSLTARFWSLYEKGFVSKFSKSLFISDVFKNNMLERHNIQDSSKFKILYNPIDFTHFFSPSQVHDNTVFLYTGSLGQWNKLENYLDFFMNYHECDKNSLLIVCTSTDPSKVESILHSPKYISIIEKVEIHYNIAYADLPLFYSRCDFGLQIMNKEDSRVGVKYIEYLAAGLTPIVNKNTQGAALLSKRYNIGVVVSGNESSEELYSLIKNADRVNRSKENYKEIKKLTDLGSLDSILDDIYFS